MIHEALHVYTIQKYYKSKTLTTCLNDRELGSAVKNHILYRLYITIHVIYFCISCSYTSKQYIATERSIKVLSIVVLYSILLSCEAI